MQSVVHRLRRPVAQAHNTLRKLSLATVRICETFTTLAFGRLASPFFSSTWPGALALLKFDVIRHATLIAIALRLNTSFWTTTQG